MSEEKDNKEEISVEVKDNHEESVINVNRIKKSAHDGPMGIKHEDLTDKAIDDIAKSDTEKAMKAEDEKTIDEINDPKGWKRKIKAAFHWWWDEPKRRYTGIGGALFLIFLISVIPVTRYAVLNTVGFRADATLLVRDESTGQPLRNVEVTMQNLTSKSTSDGVVFFEDLRLGSTEITISKLAFADEVFTHTLGIGGNEIGEYDLTPTGTQFSFKMVDWLSDQPIRNAEVIFGESSALSNSEGLATLTIQPTNETDITVEAIADLYLQSDYTIDTTSDSENVVEMRTNSKHFFVSQRDGTYDLYSTTADGKQELLVKGTGNERDDFRYSVSPDASHVAMVSTRDGNRDGNGFLLSGLFKVNTSTQELERIDESERIDLIGWVDNRLVYVKIASGASGKNPERHRLMTVDLSTGESTQIAATNFFNDVSVTKNRIYYAPSDIYQDEPDSGLFRSDAFGNKTKIHNSEVWTIIQTGYNQLVYDAKGDWRAYNIEEETTNSLDGPPNSRNSRIYATTEKSDISLWVDQRDGEGVLLSFNPSDNIDNYIWQQNGLQYPITWLSDKHVVFRIANGSETADYILNVEGGEPEKLTDVANVSGVDRWYYY